MYALQAAFHVILGLAFYCFRSVCLEGFSDFDV